MTDDPPRWQPFELDALWRGNPDFIGPGAPPMVLWGRAGSPPDTWMSVASVECERIQPPITRQLEMSF